MSTAELAPSYVSIEEYLKYERSVETRNEWYRGVIYAMTGPSLAHNRISTNLNGQIYSKLRGRKCEGFSNTMRTQAGGSDPFYTYPDAIIVCGEDGPQIEDEHKDTLLNPTVIFEILSPSTERFDRGEKAAAYRRIRSLRQYVLISQVEPHIEVFTRQSRPGSESSTDSWLLSEVYGLEGILKLESAGIEISLIDLFENVALAPHPAPPAAAQPGD
jgi:Uma2 family endonuclease